MSESISQLMDLSEKTVIVTGAAMGIGLGIAKRLSEAKANIVLVDLNEEAGKAAAQELAATSKAIFVQADVSSEADVQKVVDTARTEFGGIDVLVNNAGIYPMQSMLQMEAAKFDKVIAVNLRSVFILTKAVAQLLIDQGRGGKIINITSIDALHPSSIGLAAYDASKHGLWGFTKNAALELAPYNIQVNAIAPGGIATPGTGSTAPAGAAMEEVRKKFTEKIPMHRFGEADDIGKVALFLASGLSSYVTGAQIVVDGGVLLS
ncbi:MAG: SDR family oxidoreductase [Candidatus Pacebacteria bacterium]|nr:SDR family oxidoreductase [Candidatus Paceibacterota bacterium]